MIKVEEIGVKNFKDAFRGMRNAFDSWSKSDSKWFKSKSYSGFENYKIPLSDSCIHYNSNNLTYFLENDIDAKLDIENPNKIIDTDHIFLMGEADLKLARTLTKSGTDHGKFTRYLIVTMDLTGPFDFWKQYDTYKIGTVANSCSTMHTITKNEIVYNINYSLDSLREKDIEFVKKCCEYYNEVLNDSTLSKSEKTKILSKLNLLGFNQKRTLLFNYQVLYHMYKSRKGHLLAEWQEFRDIIEKLPYFKALFLEA